MRLSLTAFTAFISLLLGLLTVVQAYHETLTVPKIYRDNFEEKAVTKVPSPTDLEFTPDDKYLFVTSKYGSIWRVAVSEMDDPKLDADDAEPEEIFEIPHKMCLNGARGLGGIAIHPRYPSEPYIYVYHNYDKYDDCSVSKDLDEGPVNRMSRWTLNADLKSVDENSELVMFETRRLNAQTHNSGYIGFGKDGYVYVTVGEAGSKKNKSTDGTPYPMANDVMLGVVVRLTDDGQIPPTNPYSPQNDPKSVRCNKTGESGSHKKRCQEIYATGLRNPYRFAMDPNAEGTRFFINDVGDARFERVLEGGDGHAGANYGYPEREGPCVKTTTDDYECSPEDWLDYPVHWYHHNAEDGGAITGGAFVPRDAGWPASFEDSYIYGEYAWGGIRIAHPNRNAECPYDKCEVPISPWDIDVFSDEKKVVGMLFGPHKDKQALYYIVHYPGGKSGEAVFRIAFTGEANRDPKARIEVDKSVGFVPFTVSFDGADSYDPDDGDTAGLQYEWDFDGDGQVDSTEAKPQYTYTTSGTFEPTLVVRDPRGGKSDKATARIDVDNSPPIPKIESPVEGTTFAVGDKFVLKGSAWDLEDGLLPDTSLTWEVRQHHNNHYHPFLDPTVGNNIEVSDAPSPEDFYYLTTTTSYLAIHLTATDANGLSSTVILDIQPRLVNLIFDTVPSGIPLLINQDEYETPTSLIGWENDKFEIEAPTRLNKDGTKLVFASWSDGKAIVDGKAKNVRNFKVPAITDPDPLVATFEQEEEEEAIYTPEEESEDGGDEMTPPEPIPIEDEDETPKKSTKFIVGLLDMSVSVRFANEAERRRRLGETGNVDLVSLLEKDLKDTVSDAMSSAIVSAIDIPGSRSAPLHGIRFARKGEKATVDGDGLVYTSKFGGLAVFDREDEEQEVPTEFMIQAMQVEALSEVEDELLGDLREYVAEAGDMMGYSHVRSVSAEVIAKPDTGSTTRSGDDGKDSAYVGLLVVAILLCSLIAAGGIYVYFKRQRSQKEKSAAFCIEAMADDIDKDSDGKKDTYEERGSGSDTDDESPAASPMKQYPNDSLVGGSRPLMMLPDEDDDSSVASSVASSVGSAKRMARNLLHSLSSVLGPDDREDFDEQDDSSLVPVIGHDAGHIVQDVEHEDAINDMPQID